MPDGQSAVDMAPMIRRGVARHRRRSPPRHRSPAARARPSASHRRAAGSRRRGGRRAASDRVRRAATARTISMRETTVPKSLDGPAHEGEDAAGSEADDAPATVEDFLFDVVAEADPVLDPLLDPGQFDMGEAFGRAASRAPAVARIDGAVLFMLRLQRFRGIRAPAARAACRRR